jgi:hypothetical protein
MALRRRGHKACYESATTMIEIIPDERGRSRDNSRLSAANPS